MYVQKVFYKKSLNEPYTLRKSKTLNSNPYPNSNPNLQIRKDWPHLVFSQKSSWYGGWRTCIPAIFWIILFLLYGPAKNFTTLSLSHIFSFCSRPLSNFEFPPIWIGSLFHDVRRPWHSDSFSWSRSRLWAILRGWARLFV